MVIMLCLSHDSSVGELMHLTVGPRHVPGHDSSVGELMYLTLRPLHGQGHDSSVGELMHLTVGPPCGAGSIPGYGGVYHTMPTRHELAWQNVAQSLLNGITQPVKIEVEGRSPTTDRQMPR